MGYSKVYWEYGTAAKASSVKVFSPALTTGNIVAQEALRAAFESAVDAVSIGNSGSQTFVATETAVAKNPSTDPLAQRENKWLVSAVDDTTLLPVTFTIPCADLSLLGTDGETMAAGATLTALVSAVEAFVLSNAGNSVTVTSVRFRARNI